RRSATMGCATPTPTRLTWTAMASSTASRRVRPSLCEAARMINPLHSPKDAARALGVSVKTLNGFVRDGEIRYIDVGRGKKKIRRMFTDEDMDEFKERRARREVPCQYTSTK